MRTDARADEGPPFEVRSGLPILSIASILASTDGSAEDADVLLPDAEDGGQQSPPSAAFSNAVPEVPACLLQPRYNSVCGRWTPRGVPHDMSSRANPPARVLVKPHMLKLVCALRHSAG